MKPHIRAEFVESVLEFRYIVVGTKPSSASGWSSALAHDNRKALIKLFSASAQISVSKEFVLLAFMGRVGGHERRLARLTPAITPTREVKVTR